MDEGVLSLMQMAKTSAALARMDDARQQALWDWGERLLARLDAGEML